MVETTRRSWYLDRPLSGFAFPTGRLGRLFGQMMAILGTAEQREALAAVAPQAGERVLEVGYGPGVLLELLLGAGATVGGVDPSPDMCALARRRSSEAVAAGQADIRVGSAEENDFPDASFDAAISVNNVPMWSELDSGMRGLRRAVRPGGLVIVAWHGGTNPSRIARRLTLPDDALDAILNSMRTTFGNGERADRQHLVTFQAEVPAA